MIFLGVSNVNANEREDLLEIKNTITNLIDELVSVGVLAEDKADLMKQTASAKAKVQAADEAAAEEEAKAEQQIADSKAVRVQYVPDHVKQEIRDQVRSELRQEVVGDVMAQAKNERWGVPDALPEWIGKVSIGGDVRVRTEGNFFSSDIDLDTDNDGFRDVAPNFLALNEAQQNLANTNIIVPANLAVPQNPDQFFDERERSRERYRARLRLNLDANINTNVKVGARITTGNINSPVSVNQDLGNTGERYDLQLDRAYIKYTGLNVDAYPWLTLWAGRFENPFYSSSLVFDNDISFQGFAVGIKHNLAGNNSLFDIEDDSKTLFINVGAFPLQEFEVTPEDKWLVGGQIGSQLVFNDQSKFKFAVSYYDYVNTTGRRNQETVVNNTTVNFQPNDFTAPQFLQGGNTMFDIRNDRDISINNTDLNTALYALASDYSLFNLTASYDWAGLAPIHLFFDFDFVKNLGYNKKDILERIVEGGNGTAQVYQDQILTDAATELEERENGFYLKLTAGWPSTVLKHRWQVFAGYKYLERDAVLDAFAESNFHLGGTNAKGFILGARYGVNENTWLRGRWMSSDSIDGPDVGIDVLQFDVNAQF